MRARLLTYGAAHAQAAEAVGLPDAQLPDALLAFRGGRLEVRGVHARKPGACSAQPHPLTCTESSQLIQGHLQ